MGRIIFTTALIVGLTGCTSGDILLEQPAAGYVVAARAEMESVDWSQAQIATVQLSEFKFEPSRLVFQEGMPSRIILQNVGNKVHTFVAEDFFKSIAARKLVGPDRIIANPYLRAIEVRPGVERELLFIPVRKGTYDLACTVFLHDTFGMEGEITIQ